MELVDNKPKRLELYLRAHQILVNQDVPVFPVYTKVAHHLIANRIISFPTNVMEEYKLKNTKIQ